MAQRAAQTSREKETPASPQMKAFRVERFHIDDERGSHDMLKITCPHCEHEAWVKPLWARGKRIKFNGRVRIFRTASCPYCFKTARRAAPEND